jgi:hypothetical protein
MKPFNLTRVLPTFFVSCLVSSLLLAPVSAQDFCWRDTSTRGAGTIPTTCPSGTVQDPSGLLCYPPCPSGYTMVGPVCWQQCPSGYVDTGALCHINKPLTTSGKWECTSRDMFGTCWWSVLRCPSGYTNAGVFCALTTPSVPAGYSGATGLDLTKKTVNNGAGRIKDGCPSGKSYQNGLCYQNCPTGYTGIGPVCWAKPPQPTWVECGMGSSKDSATCGMTVFDQVSSVGNLAASIASLGSSSMATSAAKTGKLAQLREAFAAAKAANPKWAAAAEAGLKVKEAAEQTKTAYDVLATDSVPTAEDIARLAAMIASFADPSGAMGVVAAYTYPKCSKLFPH